ncbi:SF1B family DNA helicase RecD2 [Isobaculum melis]|uniref:ATP-dependent RecD2 DNA helicase n=1 Tax=Isobaculum melis TaxID=142588 RepID=A0A1H9S3K1_9LACT|nr:ATP-dependent RecD-like DNA helicase [Isobaculum melis]SER79215.1 ATP-dependent DNA helicase, RecD/TraA family [Isobaculum melis]
MAQENLNLFSAENPYIAGTVVAIFYQNPTNFYKVILLNVTDTNTDYLEREIVVTGTFGKIQEGEPYRFFGKLTDHPKFGMQFNAETYQTETPTSEAGIVAYLSSEKFQGIGKKTAQGIVDHLGESAIDDIVRDPTVLNQVPGMNAKKIETIVNVLSEGAGMEKVIIQLNGLGLGNQLAFAVYQHYQERTLEVIQENPYQLIEDIENIGFIKADGIADQLGIQADSPERMQAAILFALNEACLSNGNTYTTAEPLLLEAIQLLESHRPIELNAEEVAEQIVTLMTQERIIEEEGKLYLPTLYYAEVGVATSIHRLLDRKNKIHYQDKDIQKEIRILEKRLKISYGDSQKQAMEEAILSPIFILTGGPGTGKTTVLNGIVELFAELNGISLDLADYTNAIFPILLAAPTGRAAKRMNESTGLPSSTIHRLLGLNGRENPNDYQGEKELEGGLLIIDEMSMVDTWLANQLLKAIPNNMQVIFVGDQDQLPSVGPGQILHDLLKTKSIPSMELVDIYRQEDGSTIVNLAHDIKNGQLPADFMVNQKDRSFFQCQALQIEGVIKQVVERAKNKGFTAQDIQVLAPMYRGPAGIDALNKMMQEIFNPNLTGKRKEVRFNDKVYRIGDKVLQLVNYPEMNVYNGDMGEIVGIQLAKETDDKVDELTIQFDSNEVTYKRNEFLKITLAYCCSIHKSQGSEFKMVILPMVRNYSRMLRRDLLYTAITRSRDLLILCGEVSAFADSVEKTSDDRLTTLADKILGIEGMTEKLAAYEVKEKEKIKEAMAVKQEEKAVEVTAVPIVKEVQPIVEAVDLFAPVVEEVPEKGAVLTIQLVQSGGIDPMIGMKELTPMDFL